MSHHLGLPSKQKTWAQFTCHGEDSPDVWSTLEKSRRFFQNFRPRRRLRLRDSRKTMLSDLPRRRRETSSESPLAMRAITRGESALDARSTGVEGALLAEVGMGGKGGMRSPSCSQGTETAKGSLSENFEALTAVPGGIAPSFSVVSIEDGCVDGECWLIVAVPELTVCGLEEGKDVSCSCGPGCDFWVTAVRLPPLLTLFGALDLFNFTGEPGAVRVPVFAPLVTTMVVRLSSLLPRRDPG